MHCWHSRTRADHVTKYCTPPPPLRGTSPAAAGEGNGRVLLLPPEVGKQNEETRRI